MGFYNRKKVEMDAYGYTILEGMADPFGMVPHMQLKDLTEEVPAPRGVVLRYLKYVPWGRPSSRQRQ